MKGITVPIEAKSTGFDETIEKVNQLKSLLQEVKELATSLDVSITVNGKPIQTNQKYD